MNCLRLNTTYLVSQMWLKAVKIVGGRIVYRLFLFPCYPILMLGFPLLSNPDDLSCGGTVTSSKMSGFAKLKIRLNNHLDFIIDINKDGQCVSISFHHTKVELKYNLI